MAPAPTLQPAGPLSAFESSHRFVLSYRSYRDPSLHSTTLIYRHAEIPVEVTDEEDGGEVRNLWFGIANECPHLGAPLEQGQIDIEDMADESAAPIILCPWHQYDFSLQGGESSTGMKACTFKVEARDGMLWVEPPGDLGDDYRLLGIRAVSERFAEDPSTSSSSTPLPSVDILASPPKTLIAFCRLVLLASDPDTKVALTRELVRRFRNGELKTIGTSSDLPPPDEPPRPSNVVVVAPGKAQRIGKGGTAAIEQWAIDLAIDVVCRFWNWRVGSVDGKEGRRLPMSFFADFLKVAEDEAKHFTLLRKRMKELGTDYGDLPVHHGLWESAHETSHSLFSRLAIIHLVHEARGLDTNPRQIQRCKAAGDHDSAETLQIIHDDEITHVACGHRHFTALCAGLCPPVDPVATFRNEVRTHFYGSLRGPYNEGDREKAGLDQGWYAELQGRAFGAGAERKEGGVGEGVAESQRRAAAEQEGVSKGMAALKV